MRHVLVVLVLVLAGCGGDDDDSSAVVTKTVTTTVTPPGQTARGATTVVQTVTGPRPTRTTGRVTVTTPHASARPDAKPTGKPRFRVSLTGESGEARVGDPWSYTVTARAGRRPGSGTAKMRVFVGRELVDTIGFFAFTGQLRRTHRWPVVLRGKRVTLQAEVEGAGGTQRVNLPVTVR